PSTALLQIYAFLAASTAISPHVRSAIFADIAALPGLRLCGSGTDRLRRRGQMVCESDPQLEIRVLIDAKTGSVLSVEQHLRQRLHAFADLPPGTLIESDTF